METRGRFLVGTSIHQRHKDVRKRKTLAIGNWIPLYKVGVKVKLVQPLLLNAKHASTSPQRFRIARHISWKLPLVLSSTSSQKASLRQRQQIEARNLPVIKLQRIFTTSRCTLLINTHHSNADSTRTLMAHLENFSPKGTISQWFAMKNQHMLSILSIVMQTLQKNIFYQNAFYF